MIVDAFIFLGVAFLNITFYVLSLLTFAVPSQIETALTWFFTKALIFQGIFPITTLALIVAIYISAVLVFYAYKISLWIASRIPGIKETSGPELSKHSHINKYGGVGDKPYGPHKFNEHGGIGKKPYGPRNPW